jgi:hypothetical protein
MFEFFHLCDVALQHERVKAAWVVVAGRSDIIVDSSHEKIEGWRVRSGRKISISQHAVHGLGQREQSLMTRELAEI